MSKCCSKCNSTLHTTGEHKRADLESREGKVKEFDEILKDCEEKYKKKLSEYGESWREMLPAELVKRLFLEMDELATATNPKEAYEETIDVINCALMVAVRVKQDAKRDN